MLCPICTTRRLLSRLHRFVHPTRWADHVQLRSHAEVYLTKREIFTPESSAVSREGESKTAGSAPVSVGGEDQPSAGATTSERSA